MGRVSGYGRGAGLLAGMGRVAGMGGVLAARGGGGGGTDSLGLGTDCGIYRPQFWDFDHF